MTREEFLEIIDGFENFPFKITINGNISSPLKFSKCLSDSVMVLSNGKPAVYKYASIESLTFDVESDVPQENAGHFLNVKSAETAPDDTLTNDIDHAKRTIWVREFSLIDHTSELKEAIHDTPLEKEWTRTQNMIKDAQKNHVLPEKIKGVISQLERLPKGLECVEFFIMYGEAFALDNDYANASLQFERAGDYQSAAYYASRCGSDSDEYLLEIFRKWILSGENCGKDVFASFMSLCHSMHYGRICAETIKQVNCEEVSEDVREIIHCGLVLVLSNYILSEKEWVYLKENGFTIQNMIVKLLEESASEQYAPDKIITLRHANEIELDKKVKSSEWEENLEVGYIIKAWPTYGYIGKERSDNIGVKFNLGNIANNDLSDLMSTSPQDVRELKVAYNLRSGPESHNALATDIEPAEDLEKFKQYKGINIAIKTHVKTAEEKLIPNHDGKTYSGYIIRIIEKAGYGFIYKENDTNQNGVYFHVSELEERIRPYTDRILGLKVKCQLADSTSKNNEKVAIKIQAAEDIETFLTNHTRASDLNKEGEEIVNDNEVTNMLKRKTPSAALQEFATTNRPLHALEVLERSRDSFSYDKYVKHKIQLLQRTRSSDNELISLLNYAISTSYDNAYKAHNLYFLGQVQYRCKQYADVVVTMNRLSKYIKFMKSPTMNTDSIFLLSSAYYMQRDYANADENARKLLDSGAHIEEANKILNRTFATEENIQDHIDDNDVDLSLQFDSDVAITPYIENLINSFSFGSISVRDVPSDFDPSSSECSVDEANDYILRLIKYDKKSEQKNNPNPAIAIAKIQKWLIQQISDEKAKEDAEEKLRYNVSRALQIMSRNTMQQSGVDIRVNLFYRMQQYKMSVQKQKSDLFNAYINAHYAFTSESIFNGLKPASDSEPKGTDPLLIISDILFMLSYMGINEFDDENRQVKKLCEILASRKDSDEYVTALQEIFKVLNVPYDNSKEIYPQIFSGSEAFQSWFNNKKKDIRDKAEARLWNELCDALENFDRIILSENECAYFEKVQEIVRYLIDIDNNTQTAMKQNVLNQSKNQLNELEEKLQKEPTYILYSIFADVLSIMDSSVLFMLKEVMSHEPDIESSSSLQLNLGLTDRKEFILPLEFINHAPSIQARNLTLFIENMTNGVSLNSPLPMGQSVDEGEKYSQSLTFRLDQPNISQVDICIKVVYNYDVFTNYKNESSSQERSFNYTITFCEVEPIRNRYRQYAQKQTVRDKSMFFGRDILIQKLYDAISIKNEEYNDVLNGGNGVVLYGQRRSGKTSILFHLKRKIVETMKNTIVVDLGSSARIMQNADTNDEQDEKQMQRSNSNMTLQNLYYKIISGIRDFIEEQTSLCCKLYVELSNDIEAYEAKNHEDFFPKLTAISDSQNPQLIFNAFLDRFKKVARVDDLVYGFRVVVIIDEFTYFNAAIENKKLPGNFMEILKGLVSDSFITMVVAGQDNMVEFMEKYVNEFSSFQREWVTFLEKDASYKMVTEPIGEERIDAGAVEKLYRFTAGSPYLLMDICCVLVDWMNENKIFKLASSLLDDFLLKKYMKDYEFKEDLLEPQYKDAGKLEWTEKIKLVLGLIARQNSKKVTSNVIPWNEFNEFVSIKDDMLKDRGITSDEMNEILERLVKRQVIEMQEGNVNRFRIKIPLCREWILRRGGSEYGNE